MTYPKGRGRPRLSVRLDESTIRAMESRAHRLGLDRSTWARDVIRDALLLSRTDEVDAAVATRTLNAERNAQASVDARLLADQIRPLAINVNDLDRRARRGEPVTLAETVPELVELLSQIRRLLGDRTVGR